MNLRSYWAPVYNHGNKIDYIIEMEQVDGNTWKVVVDDDPEFLMSTTTQPSDFWALVSEAVTHRQTR